MHLLTNREQTQRVFSNSVVVVIMEPLCDLVRRTTMRKANSALCESFFFPKTDTVRESFDKAVVQLDQLRSFDPGWLNHYLTTHQELSAYGGRSDVMTVLSAMQPLINELNLDLMDGLIVYRGGLIMLAVRLTGNNSGRCAYVDIDNYRRRLETLASAKSAARTLFLQGLATVIVVAATCAAIVV